MSTVTYSETRVYKQAEGSFRAWATVERAGADGKVATRTEFSTTHADPMAALAEALQLAGIEDAPA